MTKFIETLPAMKYLLLLLACLPSDVPQLSFREQVLDDNIQIGYGVAVGDVDGDSKPDVLLADKNQIVWYRNGDWKKFVMAENLTPHDNVCLAARDIDGDGKVEVAVGAQWNPSETSDTLNSGAVFFLERPADPTAKWKPVALHHEPTVHRMRWVRVTPDRFHLVVLPLHGRGNRDGTGKGVRVIAYERPVAPGKRWTYHTIDQSMHLTHNFDVQAEGDREVIYVSGKEGVKKFSYEGRWKEQTDGTGTISNEPFGEVRVGRDAGGGRFVTGVQPMHGNALTVYHWPPGGRTGTKTIITDDLRQGHALAAGDLSGDAHSEIVVGWREPNAENKTGIRIYSRSGDTWEGRWLDENGIACEDLLIEDLNGDGKKDIIASGRATRNVKVYWSE